MLKAQEQESNVENDYWFRALQKAACMRSIILQQFSVQLKDKKADHDKISNEDIESLKQNLIQANKQDHSKATITDLCSFVRYYNELYAKHKDDTNNKYFLDTLLPVLFEGHDFTQIKKSDDPYGVMMNEPKCLFHAGGGENTYLLSSLIYTYGVSIHYFEDHSYEKDPELYFIPAIFKSIDRNGFILNGEKRTAKKVENRIAYLKAIFTPPASWIKDTQKEVLPAITTVILCLNRLKQQNPVSFTIPKRLRDTCILPLVVENSIPSQVRERCTTINADVHESIKYMRKGGYKDSYTEVTNFVYNDLEAWVAQHTDIVRMTYTSLMNKK
jgi:hypothetical protein